MKYVECNQLHTRRYDIHLLTICQHIFIVKFHGVKYMCHSSYGNIIKVFKSVPTNCVLFACFGYDLSLCILGYLRWPKCWFLHKSQNLWVLSGETSRKFCPVFLIDWEQTQAFHSDTTDRIRRLLPWSNQISIRQFHRFKQNKMLHRNKILIHQMMQYRKKHLGSYINTCQLFYRLFSFHLLFLKSSPLTIYSESSYIPKHIYKI